MTPIFHGHVLDLCVLQVSKAVKCFRTVGVHLFPSDLKMVQLGKVSGHWIPNKGPKQTGILIFVFPIHQLRRFMRIKVFTGYGFFPVVHRHDKSSIVQLLTDMKSNGLVHSAKSGTGSFWNLDVDQSFQSILLLFLLQYRMTPRGPIVVFCCCACCSSSWSSPRRRKFRNVWFPPLLLIFNLPGRLLGSVGQCHGVLMMWSGLGSTDGWDPFVVLSFWWCRWVGSLFSSPHISSWRISLGDI
mmetsp:Transcript_7692/g.21908  ORF Transcript_7692/g.21908 Transcript_7692/m.21908 type:complete len:242 (+) Transcript_7692:910-1635(+)